MGNYVFTTSTLIDAVTQDSDDEESHHDLGGDIIPMLVKAGQAHFYDFTNNEVPGVTEREQGYWRDVGTLDAYYDAHMDLVSVHPVFNLYNRWWPIHTSVPQLPPAKFVHEAGERAGRAVNSMVCAGAIVSGGLVRGSVLSPGRARATTTPWWRTRCCSTTWWWARAPSSAGPSSTRTWSSPRAPASASTTRPTPSCTASPSTGWW